MLSKVLNRWASLFIPGGITISAGLAGSVLEPPSDPSRIDETDFRNSITSALHD
jgi:hypothetical protein